MYQTWFHVMRERPPNIIFASSSLDKTSVKLEKTRVSIQSMEGGKQALSTLAWARQ